MVLKKVESQGRISNWAESLMPENIPLVSVIIPAYNAEGLILETLESIFSQTWPRLEIIVVDDGSTDNTAEIVRKHGDRITYIYQSNSGGCAVPRNVGMSRSLGEFICFLDADDLMLPNRIATQVDFFVRYPDVGLVFSDYINFNGSGDYKQTHFATCPRLYSLLANQSEIVIEKTCGLLAEENFGITGSFMFRRQLMKEVPGFDATLRAWEDFHFYYRLARVTKAGVMNQVVMRRRIHDSNMSSDHVLMSEQGIRCCTDLLKGEIESESRRLLKLYVSECWITLSRYYANLGRCGRSLSCQWKAFIVTPDFRSLYQAGYGIARTLAISLGIHRPDSR